jgi:hypothetical protein
MENTDSNIIQSLWIGGHLSKVEQLCIKSFLDNGHEFHLYIYDEVKNIPTGTIICDGNAILNKEDIFTYQSGWGKGSVSGFAGGLIWIPFVLKNLIFRARLLFVQAMRVNMAVYQITV